MLKYKLGLSIGLIIIVILLFLFGIRREIDINKFLIFIKNFGVFAPLIFISIYIFGSVIFIPVTFLSTIGGVLFGPVWGGLYSLIGATLGSCIAFLISKHFLRKRLNKIHSQKIVLIQEKVKINGWKYIVIARITPVLHFNIQNFIFGLTDIPLKTFFFGYVIWFTARYIYLCLFGLCRQISFKWRDKHYY
ncbi:MAG: VTT domain-containing protein [bacterium]